MAPWLYSWWNYGKCLFSEKYHATGISNSYGMIGTKHYLNYWWHSNKLQFLFSFKPMHLEMSTKEIFLFRPQCTQILVCTVNSLRPKRNRHYNSEDIFKCIFLKENVWIPTKISLKFVPKGPINNIPALVQIMAWRRPGDKPLSEPMRVSLLMHTCVTRPQWVKGEWFYFHCAFIYLSHWQAWYFIRHIQVYFLQDLYSFRKFPITTNFSQNHKFQNGS